MLSRTRRAAGFTTSLIAGLALGIASVGRPALSQDLSASPGRGAPAPLTLASDPRIDASRLRVTVFASGLPYTTAMAELSDGSLLVATGTPRRDRFVRSDGHLMRMTDRDLDGVAEEIHEVETEGLPGGIVQMRLEAGVLALSSWQATKSEIHLLRAPADLEGTWRTLGSLRFTYPKDHLHDTYGIALRPGTEPGELELFFNVGSRFDHTSDPSPVAVHGLLEGLLTPESVYRVRLVDDGDLISVRDPEVIAIGLRNAAGMAFTDSGRLVLTDNGFDELAGTIRGSVDELDVMATADLGVVVPDFGFPDAFVRYPDGTPVGSRGIDPWVAFAPTTGPSARGIAGIALAPAAFPADLAGTVVAGFHGGWGDGGSANLTNPVLGVDATSGEIFTIVPAGTPGVGHLDTLLATRDALYLADINTDGDMSSAQPHGVIHRIGVEP